MGSWAEVTALPDEQRVAFYYHVAKSAGNNVDWQTGRIWRPE